LPDTTRRAIFCFVRSQTGQLGLNPQKQRAIKRYNGWVGEGGVRMFVFHVSIMAFTRVGGGEGGELQESKLNIRK
jgi:hypothetical protein